MLCVHAGISLRITIVDASSLGLARSRGEHNSQNRLKKIDVMCLPTLCLFPLCINNKFVCNFSHL